MYLNICIALRCWFCPSRHASEFLRRAEKVIPKPGFRHLGVQVGFMRTEIEPAISFQALKLLVHIENGLYTKGQQCLSMEISPIPCADVSLREDAPELQPYTVPPLFP